MKWLILGNAVLSLILAFGLFFAIVEAKTAKNSLIEYGVTLSQLAENQNEIIYYLNTHATIKIKPPLPVPPVVVPPAR